MDILVILTTLTRFLTVLEPVSKPILGRLDAKWMREQKAAREKREAAHEGSGGQSCYTDNLNPTLNPLLDRGDAKADEGAEAARDERAQTQKGSRGQSRISDS